MALVLVVVRGNGDGEITQADVVFSSLHEHADDWRPVRESNPCRRRESEAIYRDSKETCGMDSTVR